MATERTTGLTLGEKFSNEVKVFTFDYTDKLNTGDTVSSIDSITITNQNQVSGSTDIVKDSQAKNDTSVQGTFSGGTVNEFYKITCSANTANGEKLVVLGLIKVK